LASVSVVTIVKTAERAGSGQLALVLSHVVHAVIDRDHAKGVDHVVSGQIAQAVEVVQVALVSETSSLLGLGVLLDVRLRVGQMASSGGVSTADRALLEVALQNITSRKRIAAKDTHVWAIAGVSQKMALQMLGVKIGLCAVRAWEFAISILHWNDRVLGAASASGRGSRPTGSTWQDTASSL